MTQQPSINAEPLNRKSDSFGTRVSRGVLLMLGAAVIYLLMTGPLLWSDSVIQDPTWSQIVKISMIPINEMESFEFRRSYVPNPDIPILEVIREDHPPPCLDPPNDSWWLAALKSYWGLFGETTTNSYDIIKR
jgi:hypothetical protein